MKLHRLTEKGLEAFNEFLDSLTTDSPRSFPAHLLTDPEMSVPVEPPVEIETCIFANRFEAGRYLYQRLNGIPNIDRDQGLWAWLSAFYFEQLCPRDHSGNRKPGERARWIPAIGDYRKYYRHLLAGPYRIYKAHCEKPEVALALLCSKLHSPGDIVEQLASRQELVTNEAVMQVATWLYVGDDGRPKRGSGGRGPGSPRRLADVLNQFELTWDLYSMSAADLLKMLPSEFDKFRSDKQPGNQASTPFKGLSNLQCDSEG